MALATTYSEQEELTHKHGLIIKEKQRKQRVLTAKASNIVRLRTLASEVGTQRRSERKERDEQIKLSAEERMVQVSLIERLADKSGCTTLPLHE